MSIIIYMFAGVLTLNPNYSQIREKETNFAKDFGHLASTLEKKKTKKTG